MDELPGTTKTLVRALRRRKILSLMDLCQKAGSSSDQHHLEEGLIQFMAREDVAA